MAPIPMILHCPSCGAQHIDAPSPAVGSLAEADSGGEQCWDDPPHRSHLCGACGYQWRPADVPTKGVEMIATKGEKDSIVGAVHISILGRDMQLVGELARGALAASLAKTISLKQLQEVFAHINTVADRKAMYVKR